MEGTPKASKFEQDDVIGNMPDNVVTHILDRLPLQDAVRTGILARDWRYKWTMLSQLVLDKNFYKYLIRTKAGKKYGRIVSRLLYLLKGSITKFVLYIKPECKLDDEDINHWILYLSTKGIKDLTIWKTNGTPLKLPTHLFSCLELKHLKLSNCIFNPPASFHGFPNLLSLDFNIGKFWDCFTRCPVLKNLNFRSFHPGHKVKLVEIAKLANLKKLSLPLRDLDTTAIKRSSRIFELVGLLPKLEKLDLDFEKCKFIEDAARKSSPTSFPCLKALKFTGMDLGCSNMLSFAFELIRCSPNMQALEITAFECDVDPPPAIPEVEYNTMEPLQLRRVVFRDLKGLENELCLIKSLLACCPFLKSMVIHAHSSLASGEKLFARKLLKLQRSYHLVDIGYY